MYYKHDENYNVIAKSETPFEGEDSLICDEDFDLQLYDVVICSVYEGRIIWHIKKLRETDHLVGVIKSLEERQVNAELEIDYRLSMIELGLA